MAANGSEWQRMAGSSPKLTRKQEDAIVALCSNRHRQPFASCDSFHNSLAYAAHQSDSCDRGKPANRGENAMISTAEALENALAPATEPPKAATKVRGAKRARTVAPKKGKAGKKVTPAKKAPKSAKKARFAARWSA